MIHVPDVQATVDWYKAIGFEDLATYDNGEGGLSFAVMAFGSTWVYFNQEGRPSNARRREVDLYTFVEDVDAKFEEVKGKVEFIESPPQNKFYGNREFIIKDLNGFWITFAQTIS